MAGFRPLQPAPSATSTSSSASSLKHEKGSAISKSSSNAKRPKRVKCVTLACDACRRSRIKCDGVRPQCGSCNSKDKRCYFPGEEGQSRQGAMKARYETLVKLINDLQSKPQHEAEELLGRIRSERERDNNNPLFPSSASDEGSSVTSPTASISQKGSSASSHVASVNAAWDTSPPTPVPSSQTAYAPSLSSVQPASWKEMHLAPPLRPVAHLTSAAIQSFYSSSGELFHVFSREQLAQYHRSVFGLDGQPNTSRKLAICCLASVAAVGVQYNPTEFEKGADAMFYDMARSCFVDVLEQRSPDAIRVCTLLAMYNILNKATSALGYVEVGLGLSLTYGLSGSFSYQGVPKIEDGWEDYRKTWRTLLFLASWLSSTLGYLSGNADSAFQKLVPLAQVENDHACQIGQIVQSEMTRISLLKANILRTHISLNELTVESLESALQKLQEWHKDLAPEMRLSNLSQLDLPDIVRRSLFHVHLLYLGAHILIYRRIASQLVQPSDFETAETSEPNWDKRQRALLEHAEKGITAAKHSARILGLLLAEDGIFKRCWLVIFQAHTSCVVLLHSVAQKQIHNFAPQVWEEELKQAQLCLDALEYCGKVDPVALRFHLRLSSIHHSLSEGSPRGPDSMRRTEEWVSIPPDFPPLAPPGSIYGGLAEPQTPDYLLRIPAGVSPKMRQLSCSLLFALCRPWGENPEPQQQIVENKSQLCSPAAEDMEPVQWHCNESQPFSWDTEGMGIGSINARFLDSEEPSGWMPAADVEVILEEI